MADADDTPPPELDVDNLRATKVLGRGATGTVFLVYHHAQPFAALKVAPKPRHRRARHEISILRRLSAARHPFLPHLIASSENQNFISYATPYCPGGDLNVLRHRQYDQVFSAAAIRFYLAEIISALEHLHRQGIVYGDLKPENVLLQQSGHVTLTDFDLSRDLNMQIKSGDFEEIPAAETETATGRTRPPYRNFRRFVTLIKAKNALNNGTKLKKLKSARVLPIINRRNPNTKDTYANQRSNCFIGTEEYVAPEVIRGDSHGFPVDWWALGVLCYEMRYGTTPFKGKNQKETLRTILSSEPEFVGKPHALTDLMRKLLRKNPTRRLGYRRGASEVKEHEFFRGLRWDLVTEVLRPPFLPAREETEVEGGGINVLEYFEEMNVPPSPLRSPSGDNGLGDVPLMDF